MKPLKSFIIIFLLSSAAASAQNLFNVYLPLLNGSIVNSRSQIYAPVPFCLEVNSITQDNFYWSVSADVVTQGLYTLYANDLNAKVFGDVFHPRFGYAFMNKDSMLKAGLALDAPIRTGEGYGLGLTFFMKIIPGVKNVILIPQLSFGKFTNNGNDFTGGTYISAEVDMMFKLGKTTGVTFKPYLFSYMNNYSEIQYGLKIGFSKFMKNSAISFQEQ